MKAVDLHVHSNKSDGSKTPSELVDEALSKGLAAFALTDHDTTDALSEVEKYLPDDITFIRGLELTSTADVVDCHLLGYNCNPEAQELKELIKKGKELRLEKLDKRIQFLKDKWNIILTDEESNWLYSRKSIVKTHIANILVNRGLSDNNVDAMKIYLDGCKTEKLRFTGEESINAIKKSGLSGFCYLRYCTNRIFDIFESRQAENID